MAETNDLKSFQCEFESHRGYVWKKLKLRGRRVVHNPDTDEIYDPGTGIIESPTEFFARYPLDENGNVVVNESENTVRPVRESERTYSTRANRVRDGHIGQVMAGKVVLWDSEPMEDESEALKAANDKLDEVLKKQFA